MNRDDAVLIGERLRKFAGWEEPGIAASALEAVPVGLVEPFWCRQEPAAAYWVTLGRLVEAAVVDEHRVQVTIRPIDGYSWSIVVSYRWTELGKVVKKQGMTADWIFNLGGFSLEVPGEITLDRDSPGTPNDAETFARTLAETVLETA
jgi:hypothetical protein